jgi:hypothetical protein
MGLSVSGNGTNQSSQGTPPPKAGATPRQPRRLVLLLGDEQSEAADVLAEYKGADVSGNRLHADVQRLAGEYPGRWVAAEWLGPTGWTRFLWCRR